MGEKPTEGYVAHPADAARLEEAEELHFNDYAKITTGQAHYVIPQTVSQSAAANVITDFTSPPMLRAVLVELAVQGLLGKPVPEVVELEGLACMVFEDYLAAVEALGVTRTVTRSQAKATSQELRLSGRQNHRYLRRMRWRMYRRRQSLLLSHQWKLIIHANAGDRESTSRNRNGNEILWRNHRGTPAAVQADQGKRLRSPSGRSRPCWKR